MTWVKLLMLVKPKVPLPPLIEWAQQNLVPDLVLSDVSMPRMDGITLIKQLRQLPAYKYLPLLMLTTEASTEKKLQGKNAGATGWIVKPFNPEQLINTVNNVINK